MCYETEPSHEAAEDTGDDITSDDVAGEPDEDESDPNDVAPVVAPAPRRAKPYNPALRRLNEAKERVPVAAAGSWWTKGQSREAFASDAAKLQGSRGASKVKTPINFVE